MNPNKMIKKAPYGHKGIEKVNNKFITPQFNM